MKDYYKILDLNYKDNPTEDDIKRAYRKLAIKYHPDKNTDNEADERLKNGEAFKEIVEAYTILTNKEEKQKYDILFHSGSNTGNDMSVFFNILQTTLSKVKPDWEKAKDTTLKAGVDLWHLISKLYDNSIKKEEYSIFENVNVELFDLYNMKPVQITIKRRKAKISENADGITLDFFVETEKMKIRVDSLDDQLEYVGGGNLIPPEKPFNTLEDAKKYIRNKDNYGNLNLNINIVHNGEKHGYIKPEFSNYTGEYMEMLEAKSPWLINTSDLLYFKVIDIYQAITDCRVEITLPSGEIKKSYHNNILQNMMYKREGFGLPIDDKRGDMYIRFLINDKDLSKEQIDKIGELCCKK